MSSRKIVSRNALVLLLSQIATNALSFITVPLIARSLGTADYGTLYLVGVVAGFAIMVVESGQDGYVSLSVARSNTRAHEMLGVGLSVRLVMGALVALPLDGILRLLGYDGTTRLLVRLSYVAMLLGSIANTGLSVARGLEKMGANATTRVATELFHTVLLFGAIWLGFRMRGVVAMEIATSALGLLICARVLMRMRVWPARPTLASAGELLRGGVPFFLWSSIIALQPSLEGVLLSKLASPQAVGWFAASHKLCGLLLFPAGIIGMALGPTLARLQATDAEGFRRAVRGTFRASLLLGCPIAVGAFLFADAGIALVFGAAAYGPSADNLRVLSAYLLPVFLNIALGNALFASGKQLQWALCKGAMVGLAAAASVAVIPYWQARAGNGGLGAAGATVAAELVMMVCAFTLLPRGLFDTGVLGDLLRALGASAAMAMVGHLLAGAPFAVGIAGSLLTYGVVLTAVGGLRQRDFLLLRQTIRGALGSS